MKTFIVGISVDYPLSTAVCEFVRTITATSEHEIIVKVLHKFSDLDINSINVLEVGYFLNLYNNEEFNFDNYFLSYVTLS